MKLIKNNEIDEVKWKNLLASSPFSTPFQSLEFYQFFNKVAGQSAEVYAIEDEEGDLKGLILITLQQQKGIKSFFSRRAIIYGGPLLGFNNPDALDKLLQHINLDLHKKVIYFEIRNFKDYSSYFEIFSKNKWKYVPYLNFQLPFENKSLDDLIGGMKYNRRREIKLSMKEGCVYGDAKNEDEIRDLYKILFDLYRTKVKLPLPSIEYFIKLFNSHIGKVFVVKHNEKIIGGAFCLYSPNLLIYTLYYCGIRDYNKKIFPTHLAIVAAINFGINNKMSGLDFMGAGKPNEEYGVRNYKSEFSGSLVEYGRFCRIKKPIIYEIGKLGMKILKKI